MNDDFPFARIFLIGSRYHQTVILVISLDPLELVRTKFSNQPIPILYQIINRPPSAISFLNNKTINYNKKESRDKKPDYLLTSVLRVFACLRLFSRSTQAVSRNLLLLYSRWYRWRSYIICFMMPSVTGKVFI